jgi:hypothetical protein
MNDWKSSARQALVSGAGAGLISAAVMAAAGKIEGGTAAGPINGPSQWLFGRQAAYRRQPSVRHTATGLIIHCLTAAGWALLHERVFGRNKAAQPASVKLRNAAVTAAAANFVDYKLTPKRLQPGFDVQLSKTSMFAVYAAVAVGLTLYGHLSQSRQTTPPTK